MSPFALYIWTWPCCIVKWPRNKDVRVFSLHIILQYIMIDSALIWQKGDAGICSQEVHQGPQGGGSEGLQGHITFQSYHPALLWITISVVTIVSYTITAGWEGHCRREDTKTGGQHGSLIHRRPLRPEKVIFHPYKEQSISTSWPCLSHAVLLWMQDEALREMTQVKSYQTIVSDSSLYCNTQHRTRFLNPNL